MKVVFTGAIFLAAFAVYLRTTCGSYGMFDDAELAGAGLVLGVPHPPGFPLFVCLERLALVVPVGGPLFRLHLLSAVSAALAVACLGRLLRRLSGAAPAVGLCLLMIGSWTFWAQAVSLKGGIYVLSLLAGSVVFSVLLDSPKRSLAALCLAAGLALVAHLEIAIVLLACLILVPMLSSEWKGRCTVRNAVTGGFVLACASSLYLYLPLRSAASPPVSWGRLDSLAGCGDVWRWSQAWSGFHRGAFEITRWSSGRTVVLVMLAVAVAGGALAWLSGGKARMMSVAAPLALACVCFFLPHDAVSGAVEWLVCLWVCVGIGVAGVLTWLSARSPKACRIASLGALALGAAFSLRIAAPAVDRSRFYAFDDYVRNVLASLEPGARVMFWFGDYDYQAARLRQLMFRDGDAVAHIHLRILPVREYGDHLEAVKREFPGMVVPAAGPVANAGMADALAARLAIANVPSGGVHAEVSFLAERDTWPRLRRLDWRASGFAACLSDGGSGGPARRSHLRGRARGVHALPGRGDRDTPLIRQRYLSVDAAAGR